MYWCNPVSYGLKALVLNEFQAPRWDKPGGASIDAYRGESTVA